MICSSNTISLYYSNVVNILQAKDLVEKAPVVIKQGIKKEDLEAMKKILLDVGAEIEII